MSKPRYTREQFLNSCITPALSSPCISTECPICQERYCNSTDCCAVTFTDDETCNHVFCRTCITTWLSNKRVNTCALCRRVLFVLEDPSEFDDYDNYDDYDDAEEEDEDEDEDEDEEQNSWPSSESETRSLDMSERHLNGMDQEYLLPPEIIHKIIQNLWYKIWWLLSCYRSHVSESRNDFPHTYVSCLSAHQQLGQTHSRTEAIGNDEGERLLPNTGSLLNSFQAIIIPLVPFYAAMKLPHLLDDEEYEMLIQLLQDIAGYLKAFIDMTEGRESMPTFPWWGQGIWGEDVKRILESL